MNREQALRCAEHVETELRKAINIANLQTEKTVVEICRLNHPMHAINAELARMAAWTQNYTQEAIKCL